MAKSHRTLVVALLMMAPLVAAESMGQGKGQGGGVKWSHITEFPAACIEGHVISAVNVTPTCVAANATSVTRVDAGAGLQGGPITSTGTLEIAPGGVVGTMLAAEAITDAHVAGAAAIAWSKVAKSGSSLADLATRSAADLDSGKLDDERLSAHVALTNVANTWTGVQDFGTQASLDGTTLTTGEVSPDRLPAAGAGAAGIVPATGLTDGMVASGAGIAYDKLDLANSIGSSDVADGSLTAADADTASIQRRITGVCATGNYLRAIAEDGAVTCGADADTTYTAGSGLGLTGTVFSVDTGAIQARVTGGCPSGQYIGDIAQDGTVTCGTDADTNSGGTVTSVGSGFGLSGGPITGSGSLEVDPAVVQQRVSGSCSAGSSIRSIAQDGAVACQADGNSGGTVTEVSTGAGLAGGPISGSGTISVANDGITSGMIATGAVANDEISTSATPTLAGVTTTGASSLATAGGNVGIGTTRPTHKLVVGQGATSDVNPEFKILAAGGSQAGVAAAVGGKATYIHWGGAAGGLNAYDYATDTRLPIGIGWHTDATIDPSVSIRPSGNVGIGTLSPGHLLDVAGAANAQNLCIAGDCRSDWPTGASPWTEVDGGISYIGGAGVSGRLGVGTGIPAPTVDFQIVSPAAGHEDADILLQTGNAGKRWFLTAADTGKFHLADDNAGASRVVVDAGGNVGIGANTPAAKLELGYQGPATVLKVGQARFGQSGGLDFVDAFADVTANAVATDANTWVPDNPSRPAWLMRLDAEGGSPDADGVFFSYAPPGNPLSFSPKMKITGSGNVGIGTTSPAATLDVNGGVRAGTLTLASQALGACDGGARGRTQFVAGASGEADALYACLRSASGTHAWVAVATG